MVQRYELKDVSEYPYDPYNDLVKSDEGDWVGYEDYAKLEALYTAAVEHMVLVHNSYNADVYPALEELYEKASGANEPCN